MTGREAARLEEEARDAGADESAEKSAVRQARTQRAKTGSSQHEEEAVAVVPIAKKESICGCMLGLVVVW